MFRAYLGIDPITGKERQTTRRGFKTSREAQLALSRVMIETEDFGVSHSENPTYEEIFEEWFEQHRQEVKPTTVKAIESKFKRVLPKFGHLKMKDINARYCQRVINEWASELKTFQDYKIQANLVFKYALKLSIIKFNPMDQITLPKRKEEVEYVEENKNFYSKEELTLFLKLIVNRPMQHMMFRLLAYTGARKGEVKALHWSDIDLKAKKVRLKKTLCSVDGKKLLQTSKTAASRRTISLDNETVRLLKEWRKKQMELYLKLGQSLLSPKEQPVFTTYHSKEQKMDYCRLPYLNASLISIYKEHDQLPQMTVHGFRHTHASLLFEAGLSIKEVQLRLGHKDIQTTMNIYTHVTEEAQEKAATKFEQFMSS